MSFEWDEAKASSNLTKHGIAFADAVGVFEDELALTIRDDNDDEERHVTVGSDCLGRVLVVVFTWREDRIRIISARRATKPERKTYAGGR